MSDFGHVEKITQEVGGREEITFKSKLEYRWAVWCQLRKEQGIIVDWEYESEVVPITYKTGREDFYRPDFTIEKYCIECESSGRIGEEQFCLGKSVGWKECPECDGGGQIHEFEETKGWFTSKDYTKMKLFAEQYDNPLTLIFAKPPSGIQYRRADGLVKLLESNGGRVIYDANKTIFSKIKHLFEV